MSSTPNKISSNRREVRVPFDDLRHARFESQWQLSRICIARMVFYGSKAMQEKKAIGRVAA
jgi:hypothetical protein